MSFNWRSGDFMVLKQRKVHGGRSTSLLRVLFLPVIYKRTCHERDQG